MKFETSPLISAIIPVFNGAEFIEEAINSVLFQTYPNIEIIVIDDGSMDDSEIKISAYKNIKYKKQLNVGPAAARNLGCQFASGEFLAFLDQDDMWLPNKIEKQVDLFLKFPSLEFVLCHQQIIFDKRNLRLPPYLVKQIDAAMYRAVPSYSPSALLVKRRLLESLGGFSAHHPFYSETDFFIRIKELNTPFEVLPETLLLKRFHQANLSFRTGLTSAELLCILRASLRRRNAGNSKDFDSRT